MTLEEVMDKLDEEFPYRRGWRYESRKQPCRLWVAKVWNERTGEAYHFTSTLNRYWAVYGVLYRARQGKAARHVA